MVSHHSPNTTGLPSPTEGRKLPRQQHSKCGHVHLGQCSGKSPSRTCSARWARWQGRFLVCPAVTQAYSYILHPSGERKRLTVQVIKAQDRQQIHGRQSRACTSNTYRATGVTEANSASSCSNLTLRVSHSTDTETTNSTFAQRLRTMSTWI